MENLKYKSKRFLIPILSLVLISILLISSIISYMTINMFKSHMEKHIKQTTQEYTERRKKEVAQNVNFVNETIKFQTTRIESILKNSLKEKLEVALNIATFTYNKYKDTHTKEEIKKEISKILSNIKYNDNRSYYFMYDNKTKIIFGHPVKSFVGKDMTNFKDAKGKSLMETDAKILAKEKIGFNKIYFTKPNNQNEQFPKITCISKFEPLDLVLGLGEYLDVIENQVKDYVLNRFSHISYNKDEYIAILDVHNLKGGEEFATMLLNSNRPELVGKKISDKTKDVKGNRFGKDFLDLVANKGSGYSEYWYKKPSTDTPSSKVSYVLLQKDWNWIILSGFYYEDLEKQISIMKESITSHTNNTINKTIIWVLLLSFFAILIATLVSYMIDKTIKRYTNAIVKYEDNKRTQEQLLTQQSKMATMGEMIGNIAHQWKQPLALISMSNALLQLNQEDNTFNSKEEIKNAITNIDISVEHLSTTIDDFRNFFIPDKQKVYFQLKTIYEKTYKLISSQFKNNNIQIIVELEDVEIFGYPNELLQVLINIINNAKDELIKSNTDNKKLIFINGYKDNEKIILKIKDNAGGIPKDIINEIFNAYFTTKKESEGTGIGLYMSKQIIEHMNGIIKVSNTKYKYEDIEYIGAEFVIELQQ